MFDFFPLLFHCSPENPANVCSKFYLELLTSVIPTTSTLAFQATLISHPACSDSLISLLLLASLPPPFSKQQQNCLLRNVKGIRSVPSLKLPRFPSIALGMQSGFINLPLVRLSIPQQLFSSLRYFSFCSSHTVFTLSVYIHCAWYWATQRHFHKSLCLFRKVADKSATKILKGLAT